MARSTAVRSAARSLPTSPTVAYRPMVTVSRTVRGRWSPTCVPWSTYATPPRRAAAGTSRLPERGARSPASACSSVDLPAPFGPIRAVTASPGIVKVAAAEHRGGAVGQHEVVRGGRRGRRGAGSRVDLPRVPRVPMVLNMRTVLRRRGVLITASAAPARGRRLREGGSPATGHGRVDRGHLEHPGRRRAQPGGGRGQGRGPHAAEHRPARVQRVGSPGRRHAQRRRPRGQRARVRGRAWPTPSARPAATA